MMTTVLQHVHLRLVFSCVVLLLLGYAAVTHWLIQKAITSTHPDDENGLLLQQRLDATSHEDGYIVNQQNNGVLFFNRVPKCGSEMLVLLLQWLQGQNTFRHVRLRNTIKRYLTYNEQLDLAAEVGEKIQETSELHVSFDRHVYFTNFTSLGLKMPIYLNLIRDPVEKMVSRFYYARVTPRPGAMTPPNYHPAPMPRHATLEECVLSGSEECNFLTGHHYDLTIPYFCGHHEYCRELNNGAALKLAKQNVEEWYPVVGVLEDINATLTVLQRHLPQYFANVVDLYYNELLAPHHNKNLQRPTTSPEVEATLRKNLSLEYDFYNFVRQRLNLQYQQLQII
ncbi:uronyl 2-sulfotransferase-like [Homarus americanus]|uniref:uronyl 2-sulfotransferase-like n=2 Tax=Homarus americanus TaxID=6706 RepID=UPI001C491367|nr:uronyl 2-sulfotransferase-like [Homarus americanus]XP_042211912.1 uronyl 2-sulfotransferase-like [Homarus americanus]